MKIAQFRILKTLVDSRYSLTRASMMLGVSQPTITRAIQQIEEYTGCDIFTRHGKQITGLTDTGTRVMQECVRIHAAWANIQNLATENKSGKRTLRIATTSTMSRYVLPDILKTYAALWQPLEIVLKQGSPQQIAQMLRQGEVDIGIAAEGIAAFQGLVNIECYQWERVLITPKSHALAQYPMVSIRSLHGQPLVTYNFSVEEDGAMQKVFLDRGIKPKLAVVATDAEAIKSYVGQGFGVGIIAHLAYDPEKDTDLVAIRCNEMPLGVIRLILNEQTYLPEHIFSFIEHFNPQLTRPVIDAYVVQGKRALVSSNYQVELLTPATHQQTPQQ